MPNKNNIPLLRAATITPLLLAAEKIGTPVDKMLRDANLSVHINDSPQMVIPEIPAWILVNNIYQMEGDPLFGLKAAVELAPQDIETIKPFLAGCANLKQLLERFISIAPTQSNVARYSLKEDGNTIWFNYQTPHLIDTYEQVELYDVAGMIQFVQLVVGEQWRPTEIHFSFGYNHHIYNAEHLNPTNITFSKPHAAIAIPRHLLPMEAPELTGTSHLLDDYSLPDTLSDQLLTTTCQYIGEEKLDNELLNKLTGMHFRTIQRKLAKENTCYSRILDTARYRKSQFLLKRTDEKLLDISLMLGFSNASAFSRAFKHWSGVSPLEFRKLNLNLQRKPD
jgi:AraC-like DNA-binding protein